MSSLRRAFALLAALAVHCSPAADDATNASRVVGGQAEGGYAPVGYLANSDYPAYKTFCGATLVAPTVVVTAAHCVQGYATSSLSVGFGTAGSAPTVAVAQAHVHPDYVYRAEGDYAPWNDVAVLELAQPVTDRVPATIARAVTGGCAHRYVGYGRDTTGDSTVRMPGQALNATRDSPHHTQASPK